MEDFTNVRLSAYASQVAEKLKERGLFDYEYDAAKFAMGYVVKNYYGSFDPATYQVEDNNGSNHSVGSYDGDGQVAALIRALYPDTTTPYRYMRALMVYGLTELGKLDEKEPITAISSLM